MPSGRNSDAPDSTDNATTAKRWSRMVLDGVSLDDRVVRKLAAILEGPLANKLEQALLYSAGIVSLTFEDRAAVFAALDRAPWEYEEIRELLLANERWSHTRAVIA